MQELSYCYCFFYQNCKVCMQHQCTPYTVLSWQCVHSSSTLLLQGRSFTAEFKLLWFLFYFSFATSCGFALIGARSGKLQQNQQLYFDYFFCETFGIDPDNPCVLDVDGYVDQSLRIATNATFTFTPYIILIYILPVGRLVRKLKS